MATIRATTYLSTNEANRGLHCKMYMGSLKNIWQHHNSVPNPVLSLDSLDLLGIVDIERKYVTSPK